MGKKVNTKFLIGLTAVIGGFAVAAFAAGGWYYSRHTSAAFLKRAAVAESAHDWERAVVFTQIASNKDPSNKPLYIHMGELCEKLVLKDQAYLGRALSYYQRALEIDPTFTQAIDRLLAIYVAEMKDGARGSAFFTELKSVADKGIASDKKNAHYQAYSRIASVQQWLFGSGHSDPLIEKNIEALDELTRQNPEESDAAYYASQAQFHELADVQTEQAHALLDKIDARYQAAAKAGPQDAAVQMRAFQTFWQLSLTDDRTDHRGATAERAAASIKAAVADAKLADDVYDDVQHFYVMWLRNSKTVSDKTLLRQQVVKVFTDWMNARPHDQRAALEMAEYLATDPAQRPEAIQLLSNPVPTDPEIQGHAALQVRGYQRQRLIALNSYRLDDAAAIKDKKDRQALLASIDADLARIASMGFGDDVPVLKLRGKLQMLRENPVDAIKSFERAQALLGANFMETDLWFHLLQAYLKTGQTGTAVGMLEKFLNRAPGVVPVRVQLTQLYLQTGQADKAAEQVKLLQKAPIDDPVMRENVSRLALYVAHRRHSDDAGQQLVSLPEKTRDERLFKARMAADMNEPAESARIYRALLHDDPSDIDAVFGWVGLTIRDKNAAQAQQLVADALKAKPDEPRLKALRDRLAANTPEAFRKLEDEMDEQVSDPRTRALRQSQHAMDRGQWALAWQRLDEADKIGADDPGVLIARLQWCVLQKKFDQAAQILDRAAATNADQMEGLALRTRVALLRNDAVEALKWANQLVGRHDEFAANWLQLGRAQQLAGLYRDAVYSCDAAIQRQPNNVEALKTKAECLESLAQFPEEKQVISEAVALAPDDLQLRDVSLNYELRHGDPDKVIARCEELLKSEPDNAAVYAATGLACEVAAQSKYRSDPVASKKLFERARDVLNQGMTKFADSPELTRFYVPQAQAMEGLGDVPAAEGLLRKLAERADQKDRPDASRELAKLYERFGRPAEAEQAWRDACARSGQSVDTEVDLAQFLIRRQHFDDALKVLDANAENPRVRNQRIETLLAAGRLAEARKLVDQFYTASPTSAVALYYRGLIEFNGGDAGTAIIDLTGARDKDPRNLMVKTWLARALLARNRRDEAVVELADALHRDPFRDDVRMLLLEADSSSPPRWDDFDQVVQEAENNPALNSNPTWHQLHARGLSLRGRFDEAKQHITAARKLGPDSFALQEENVNILVHAREWPAVLAETDKELAAGHTDGFIYGKRAVARLGMGDKVAAAKDFETGLASYQTARNTAGIADLLQTIGGTMGADEALSRLGYLPDGPERHLLAIQLYGLKDDYVNRIKSADLALAQRGKLTPDQQALALRAKAEGYVVLSRADPAHPQWEKAHQAFDELLTVQPNDESTLNNVAYLMADFLHDPEAAKAYSSRAYDLTMKSAQTPGVIDTQGWILTLCGGKDAQRGLLILQNLVQSHPNLTKARYHLAQAYLRQRLFAQAGDELGVVQQQMKQMQANHEPVDDELQAGVPRVLEEIRQKTGRASN